MDSEFFTYLPDAMVQEDGRVIEQLNDGAFRRLVRTASGLSAEAQQHLARVASQLRASEGLPARTCVEGEM
ncbi:hypothetical protein [Nocardia sp. NPDC049149]|uniref:hypothetical protein n=1 Tax=Nocardia sp. NPDC049149 TaxID=3364315 RepID=UPI0037161631